MSRSHKKSEDNLDDAIQTAGFSAEQLMQMLGWKDLEKFCRNQIRDHIERTFPTDKLAWLFSACLKAQGYETETSLPNTADGGVDILADGRNERLNPQLLCVQVKSGTNKLGVPTLREFQTVIQNFGAEMGILVSWNGFTTDLDRERRSSRFKTRVELYSADMIVNAVLEYYDLLPIQVRNKISLRSLKILSIAPTYEDLRTENEVLLQRVAELEKSAGILNTPT